MHIAQRMKTLGTETAFEVLVKARALEAQGKHIVHLEIGRRRTTEEAFQTLLKNKANALLVGAVARAINDGGKIVRLAARYNIPTMYPNSSFVRNGGLMSYGADRGSWHLAAAQYVAPILKGKKPAELPVQQPTKFELAINLKTAKGLGLEIPTVLLTIADEVIE